MPFKQSPSGAVAAFISFIILTWALLVNQTDFQLQEDELSRAHPLCEGQVAESLDAVNTNTQTHTTPCEAGVELPVLITALSVSYETGSDLVGVMRGGQCVVTFHF